MKMVINFKRKKMKQILILLVVALSFCTNAQEVIENGYYKTNLETGLGNDVAMSFSIDSITMEKIMQHPSYLNWDSTTFNNPENAEYIEKNKDKTHLEMFLMGKVLLGAIYVEMGLKYPKSYSPIASSTNRIYISSTNNDIVISYAMQAQNAYGNMLYNTAMIYVRWVDGKTETKAYVN
jgi:hypothetical protein